MIELLYDFIGFCLVILLPMIITICFLIIKEWFKTLNNIYNKGVDDTLDAIIDDIKGRYDI